MNWLLIDTINYQSRSEENDIWVNRSNSINLNPFLKFKNVPL
ncbi:hypothetical protein [Bacillus sp. J33]|nr:hypothetical protein [Bacillus sp. J33]